MATASQVIVPVMREFAAGVIRLMASGVLSVSTDLMAL